MVSYWGEFAVLWDIYSMDIKAPKAVYGTIDFGGLSTDEIMSEIRPKSDSASG